MGAPPVDSKATDGGDGESPASHAEVVRAHIRKGVRVAWSGPVYYLGLTFIGIGGLAQQADVSLGFAVASTILIWAGPAQVILFGALINGLALPAIAFSVSLSSVRLLPMCVSLLPHLRSPGQSAAKAAGLAHFIAVSAWVESIRRVPDMPQAGRIPFFLAMVTTTFVSAITATIAGFVLAASLPGPLAAGLLFVSPVYFLLALIRNARDTIDWSALVLGFLLAPVANYLMGAGLDLLAVGVVGGSISFAFARWRQSRAAPGERR